MTSRGRLLQVGFVLATITAGDLLTTLAGLCDEFLAVVSNRVGLSQNDVWPGSLVSGLPSDSLG